MKIGQIFYHPWVLTFEKEFKQKTFNYIIAEEVESTVEEKKLEKKELKINENQSNSNLDIIMNRDIKLGESAIEMKKKFLQKMKLFERKFEDNVDKNKEKINLHKEKDEISMIVYKKEEDIEEKLNIEDTNTNSKTNSSGARKNSDSSSNSKNKNEDNENIRSKSDFNYYKNKEHKFTKEAFNYVNQKQFKIPFDPNNQNQRDKLFDEVINKLEQKNSKKKKKQNIHSNTVSNNFNSQFQEKISLPNFRNRTLTLTDIQNDLNDLKKINDTFNDIIEEKPKIASDLINTSNILDDSMLNLKNNNFNDICEKSQIIFEKIEDFDKCRNTTNFPANYEQGYMNMSNLKNRYNNSLDLSNIFQKKNVKRLNEINQEINMSILCGEYSNKENLDVNPRRNLMEAIHCLENPHIQHEHVKKEDERNKSFWGKLSTFFNPFRCGKDV